MFKRAERVAGELHRALSDIVLRELKDPRIGPFSITSIQVSDDLRLAYVRIIPVGGIGDEKKLLEGLNSATGFLSRKLARRLQMKYSPKLEFFIDEHLSKALNIVQALDDLEDENEDNP